MGALLNQIFFERRIFSLPILTHRVALHEIPYRNRLQPKDVLTGKKTAAN